MAYHPLSNGFTIISLVGAVVSGFMTMYGSINPSWGFTLTFTFILFIIASYVSITPKSL